MYEDNAFFLNIKSLMKQKWLHEKMHLIKVTVYLDHCPKFLSFRKCQNLPPIY